jgi:hypothetical protein
VADVSIEYETVIQVALRVGLTFELPPTKLMQFAHVIAALEREECADIAENWRCNGCPRTVLADQIRAREKE